MHRSVIETLVGVIVIALCVLFVFVVYTNSSIKTDSAASYPITASFERADGIEVGSDVMISGVKVGRVSDKVLDLKTYTAVVTMQINKDISLPIDSSAEISSSGLLGDKYIVITPGADAEVLKPNQSIEFTQSSVSLENLIGKLMFGVSNKEDNQYQDGGHSDDADNAASQSSTNTENNAAHSNTTIATPVPGAPTQQSAVTPTTPQNNNGAQQPVNNKKVQDGAAINNQGLEHASDDTNNRRIVGVIENTHRA